MNSNFKIIVSVLLFVVCSYNITLAHANLHELTKLATKENYTKTEQIFAKAIKRNKNDAYIYADRYFFYYKFHMDELALQDINKAITLMPNKYIFYELRTDLLFELDSIEAILLDVNTMMKMDASIPDAHIYKGRYLLKIDSLDGAFNCFNNAIRIYESNNAPCSIMSSCYTQRARLNFAYGKLDDAISDFSKAIVKVRDTKKDNLLMLRANAYLSKNDTLNAYQDIGAALVLKSDTMTLAYLYALKGDQRKLKDIIAAIVAKKLKTNYREAVKLYNVACLYAIVNQKQIALEYLQKSLEFGYNDFNWIQVDYDMKNIKDLPQFSELIQKYQAKK